MERAASDRYASKSDFCLLNVESLSEIVRKDLWLKLFSVAERNSRWLIRSIPVRTIYTCIQWESGLKRMKYQSLLSHALNSPRRVLNSQFRFLRVLCFSLHRDSNMHRDTHICLRHSIPLILQTFSANQFLIIRNTPLFPLHTNNINCLLTLIDVSINQQTGPWCSSISLKINHLHGSSDVPEINLLNANGQFLFHLFRSSSWSEARGWNS